MSVREVNPNGYIYICVFNNGLVKVGRSKRDPQERIADHKRSQAVNGNEIRMFWISEAHEEYASNETSLINFTQPYRVEGTNEWSMGPSAEKIIGFANRLNFNVGDSYSVGCEDESDLSWLYPLFDADNHKYAICYRLASLCRNMAITNAISMDILNPINGAESSAFEVMLSIYFYGIKATR